MKQRRILSLVIVFVLIFGMGIPTKKIYAADSRTKIVRIWSKNIQPYFNSIQNLYEFNSNCSEIISGSGGHLSARQIHEVK